MSLVRREPLAVSPAMTGRPANRARGTNVCRLHPPFCSSATNQEDINFSRKLIAIAFETVSKITAMFGWYAVGLSRAE
jgi:hypothetical protein